MKIKIIYSAVSAFSNLSINALYNFLSCSSQFLINSSTLECINSVYDVKFIVLLERHKDLASVFQS